MCWSRRTSSASTFPLWPFVWISSGLILLLWSQPSEPVQTQPHCHSSCALSSPHWPFAHEIQSRWKCEWKAKVVRKTFLENEKWFWFYSLAGACGWSKLPPLSIGMDSVLFRFVQWYLPSLSWALLWEFLGVLHFCLREFMCIRQQQQQQNNLGWEKTDLTAALLSSCIQS